MSLRVIIIHFLFDLVVPRIWFPFLILFSFSVYLKQSSFSCICECVFMMMSVWYTHAFDILLGSWIRSLAVLLILLLTNKTITPEENQVTESNQRTSQRTDGKNVDDRERKLSDFPSLSFSLKFFTPLFQFSFWFFILKFFFFSLIEWHSMGLIENRWPGRWKREMMMMIVTTMLHVPYGLLMSLLCLRGILLMMNSTKERVFL